jgi:hypothetical protein
MNKYRHVMGGTATGVPLCRTCGHATRVQGKAESQSAVYCSVLGGENGAKRLEWEAYECNHYQDTRIPSLYEMKQVAWQLRTDAVTKKIVGFVSPEQLTVAERQRTLKGE